MPGGRALSAHGTRKLIVKTDGQTKTEKDTYAKLLSKRDMESPPFLLTMQATNREVPLM
jgi:hypothetical protein